MKRFSEAAGLIVHVLYLLSEKLSSMECIRLDSDTSVTHDKKVRYIIL